MYKVMKKDTFEKFDAAARACGELMVCAELMETSEGYDKFYRDFLGDYLASVSTLPVDSELIHLSGFTFYVY